MALAERLLEAAAVALSLPFFATVLWLLALLVLYRRWPGGPVARRIVSWYAGFRVEGPATGNGCGLAGDGGPSCVEIVAGGAGGATGAAGAGGVGAGELARSLEEAGFAVRDRRIGCTEDLRAELETGWSAIVLVGVRFYLDGRLSPAPLVRFVLQALVREGLEGVRHWVVVHRWDRGAGRFVVRAPSLGELSVADGHLARSMVGTALLARREVA